MNLFDEIQRTDFHVSDYSTPRYYYLNHSARTEMKNVRNLLEEWFVEYPDEGKEEFGVRFRSKNYYDHYSAFYELYVFTLLKKLGYLPKIHPDVGSSNNKPDFKFKYDDTECILEAKVAFGLTKEEMGQNARLNEAYDALNQVKSNEFFLHISNFNAPATSIPRKEIIASGEKFLKQQDYEICRKIYEDYGYEKLPFENLDIRGWRFQLRAMLKN